MASLGRPSGPLTAATSGASTPSLPARSIAIAGVIVMKMPAKSLATSMIVAKLKTVTDKGGRMKLLHLTRRSQRLLALMKLSLVFETFDDEALGVRSFSWNAGR